MPLRGVLSVALAAAAVLAGLAWHRHSGTGRLPRFPIGIYGPADPSVLPQLRAAGFDAYHTYAFSPDTLKDLAAEARRLGMRLVIYPNDAMKHPLSIAKEWPVAAWYLEDEPEANQVSPEKLMAFSADVRRWDPGRPQTFVIGEGSAAKRFAAIGDVLMLDWYPVPHLPLDSVAEQLDTVLSAVPKGKPVWMVVQAFDWRDSVQRDPKKPRVGRFPTHAEIRFMSYLAVMHGARGLFYYRLQKGEAAVETLLEYPELWQAVSRVAREMGAMKPIFAANRLVALPFASDTVSPEARAWEFGGRLYVVLANRSSTASARVPDMLLTGQWRPLFEMRRDPRELLEKQPDGFYLSPLRVMVFEGPWSLERWYRAL